MLVRTAEDLGVSLDDDRVEQKKPMRPGDFLEFSPILTILIVVLALGWLWQTFQSGNPLITLSGLNTYNFVFLILGILLHWRPRSLLEAFSKAMPSVSGVLLQFPFYAGIAQMLTKVPNSKGITLSDTIAPLVRGCLRQFDRFLASSRNLFGGARILYPVGRRQMGH